MDQVQAFIDSIPGRIERLDKEKVVPIVSIAAATMLLYTTYKLFNRPKGSKKIPSPRGSYPYFGHMFSIGSEPSHKVAEWHKEVGRIMKLKMGVQTWIMIDDPVLAHEVFVTHGADASHRPFTTFTSFYSHNGRGIGFSSPDKKWRDARAAAISILSPKFVDTKYMIPIQREASDLADRLIKYSKLSKDGLDPMTHLHLNSLNIIFMAGFGKRFNSIEDKEFQLVTDVIVKAMRLAGPENDISMFLPIFSIVEYFNGKTKKMADFINLERDPLYKRLMSEALEKEETNLVQEIEKYNFDYEDKLVLLSDLINGGTDSVSVTLSWVFAIMCNYPQVQRRTAAEIDHFIELNGRTPAFSDRDSLPYSVSVLKECMRFRATTAFGAPHQANNDIIVDGYHIPKGASIFYSMESMHMNPSVYVEPERFCADRFADNLQLMDSAAKGRLERRDHFNFGWGRRICPGSYMAEAEIFTTFIQVLARCRIEPVEDSNGREHYPNIEHAVNTGITLTPAPYKVNFVERNKA